MSDDTRYPCCDDCGPPFSGSGHKYPCPHAGCPGSVPDLMAALKASLGLPVGPTKEGKQ
jgi:hypothetical protein